jgi:hypothetical protein
VKIEKLREIVRATEQFRSAEVEQGTTFAVDLPLQT